MAENKGGRPSKYEAMIVPRFGEIENWLRNGFKEKEVAQKLGISWPTFCSYKNKYPEFLNLVKKSRENLVGEVKSAIFRRATGFTYTEKKTIIEYEEFDDDLKKVLADMGLDVNTLGQRKMVRTEIYEKQALPDPASCMILLKQWAKDEGWTNDPQTLEIRRQELELKKQKLEQEDW